MFELRLDEDIFNVVKDGTKCVECRLYDEKRREIKVGEQLDFIKRPLMEDRINTKVIGLKVYSNFDELVNDYDMSELYLPEFSKEDFLVLLERFYSKEEQEKYGVVAIRFEVI